MMCLRWQGWLLALQDFGLDLALQDVVHIHVRSFVSSF
jgi:hypothetical protein